MATRKRSEDISTTHMDLLMKAIKAVHSRFGTSDVDKAESLERQRQSVEKFSRLANTASGIIHTRDEIKGIPVEYAVPEFSHRKDRIILYCHGGGYTSGGLGYARILASKLALHTGVEVVSFEYRLAPENPYPAAIEDVVTIWDELMYRGYGADDVLVAGDSAGGNLALELTLVLKEQKRKIPRALILMSPWTDMTATAASYVKYKDVDPLLTYDYIMGVRNAYAGDETDYSNPSLSPLFANLDGFPPVLIQVGSNEILRSDSEQLHNKIVKAGGISRLQIFRGGWHVFQQMPIPKATKAMEDVREFVESVI